MIGIILRTVCKSRRWPYVDAGALRKGDVSFSDDFFILYQTQNATLLHVDGLEVLMCTKQYIQR